MSCLSSPRQNIQAPLSAGDPSRGLARRKHNKRTTLPRLVLNLPAASLLPQRRLSLPPNPAYKKSVMKNRGNNSVLGLVRFVTAVTTLRVSEKEASFISAGIHLLGVF